MKKQNNPIGVGDMYTDDKYILDKDGNPVKEHSLLKWAAWFENNTNRVVARTRIKDSKQGDIDVSTIFLGMDYNLSGVSGGKPILYETMVFENKTSTMTLPGTKKRRKFHKSLDDYGGRDYTRQEALKRHMALVEELKPPF